LRPIPSIGASIENQSSRIEIFESLAVKHGHLRQKEMAEKWPEPVSQILMVKALKKIKFTRKKTYRYGERNEQARAEFQKG
jgi:hypothetical protein